MQTILIDIDWSNDRLEEYAVILLYEADGLRGRTINHLGTQI